MRVVRTAPENSILTVSENNFSTATRTNSEPLQLSKKISEEIQRSFGSIHLFMESTYCRNTSEYGIITTKYKEASQTRLPRKYATLIEGKQHEEAEYF